jgi:hypothetical protein
MKTATEVKASPYCADSKDAYTDSWCTGGGHWRNTDVSDYRWSFGHCNGAVNDGSDSCVNTTVGVCLFMAAAITLYTWDGAEPAPGGWVSSAREC